MSQNTLVVHGCGGCGISVLNDSFNKLAELGDGFAKIRFHYLDTSRANIDKIEPKGEFWLVKTKTNSKGEIVGSGGERKFNASDIMANVNEYLDQYKYLKRDMSEFHIVVASASGGSGNVLQSTLIKNLLSKSIPVIAIVIGDSSNGLNAINTMNTLASLNAVAKATNKPLSVIYINNQSMVKDGGMNQAEKDANKYIFNIMASVSLFLSGQNEAIDNQDMYGIIDQSHYTTITITPGLYGLTVHGDTIKLPEGAIPTTGRTLTLEGHNFDTNLTLLHHKRGYITSENARSIFTDDKLPVHMVSYANFLKIEEANLKSVTDDYYHIMDTIKNENISGSARSSVDDDSGLVF